MVTVDVISDAAGHDMLWPAAWLSLKKSEVTSSSSAATSPRSTMELDEEVGIAATRCWGADLT